MNDPPPRQRSCGECVKGKRRCDRTLPGCKRCEKRKVRCHYPAHVTQETLSEIMEHSASSTLEITPSFTSLMAHQPTWNNLIPVSSDADMNTAAWSTLNGFSLRESFSPPFAFDTLPHTITGLARQEMTYCVNEFRTYPQKWIRESRTPFIHPRLYADNIPRTLQEAYCACAVYSTRTESNSLIAFTIIETKSQDLLRSFHLESSSTLELLAALQALIVFQVIGLFDGDIRQRAIAEASWLSLDLWTETLRSRTASELTLTTTTAMSWDAWILAESIRRTLVMSFMIRGIYEVVKQGFCTNSASVTALSFTAQSRLWNAKTAHEWRQVCREESPYWVQRMQFDDLFEKAWSGDVDDFGKMMAVTYHGEEKMNAWLQDKQNDFLSELLL